VVLSLLCECPQFLIAATLLHIISPVAVKILSVSVVNNKQNRSMTKVVGGGGGSCIRPVGHVVPGTTMVQDQQNPRGILLLLVLNSDEEMIPPEGQTEKLRS